MILINQLKIKPALILPVLLICVAGCKKLVEVQPPVTGINTNNIFTNDVNTIGAMTGIYSNLAFNSITTTGGLVSLSFFAGLSSDEFTLYSSSSSASYSQYYLNALNGNTSPTFWSTYSTIYPINAVLDGLNNSSGLTPAVKKQLTGEAKFMRGFCYFYLVNLFGDVPLVVSSNYAGNVSLSRTPKAQVWQQIISDLKDAQGLLTDKYVQPDAITAYAAGSSERIRPNKWAATAMLARAYLYTGDWAKAEDQATQVISNTAYYNLASLNNAFLKNSTEAIWQLQPVIKGYNTPDATVFIIPPGGFGVNNNPVYLSNSLLNSFEPGDQRRAYGNWIDSISIGTTAYYYPYKYKVYLFNAAVTSPASMSEYVMVLRLAEQYLIRAEARAQQGNIAGAQSDLNMIRFRAGLAPTSAGTQPALLAAILHERQVELFTEWGHRWLDLKRTNQADAVMSILTLQKGGTWSPNWQLYPIPLSEIQKDPNLTQNLGY